MVKYRSSELKLRTLNLNQNMMENLRKVLGRKLVSFDSSFRGFFLAAL